MVIRYEHDMDEVHHKKHKTFPHGDGVAKQEDGKHGELHQKENGVTHDDPPVHPGVGFAKHGEDSLDHEGLKSCLIDCGSDTDIANPEENCCVHCISGNSAFGLEDVDAWVDEVVGD